MKLAVIGLILLLMAGCVIHFFGEPAPEPTPWAMPSNPPSVEATPAIEALPLPPMTVLPTPDNE